MRWQAQLIVIATVAALAHATASRAAAPDDFHVDLTYDVPGQPHRCWDEAEFRLSVARRLGYDPFRAGTAIGVLVRVDDAARGVEGRIEWRSANGASMGERKLAGKDGDCGRLLTEVSFAVVLQIELLHPQPAAQAAATAPTVSPVTSPTPTTTVGTTPVTEPPPSPPASTPAPPRPATAPPERADVSARVDQPAEPAMPAGNAAARWALSVGAGPALAWRLAPSLTADGRLFVAARRRNLSIELAGEATYPSTTHQADGSGFRHGLLGGSVALCGHRRVLSACAVGRASQVRVTGLDVDQPRTPDGFALQAGGRLAATLPLRGPWSGVAYGELLGLVTPYRVTLNQFAVWDMPRLAALAGLALSARFR